MRWKQATLAQLYEIAWNDKLAHITYITAARREIQRRRKQQYTRVHYKFRGA